MRIRYQNGTSIECAILSCTAQSMRLAVKGGNDVMALTDIHGTWVTEDCEPVSLEMASSAGPLERCPDDYFICSEELATHLLGLLFAGDEECFPEQISVLADSECESLGPIA